MRISLAVIGILVAASTVRAETSIPLAERLSLLKQAYPQVVRAIDGNTLRLHGGQDLMIDDGRRKSHQDKLKNADVEDMLSQVYPLGKCVRGKPAKNFDPGRIRSDAFFRAVYGQSKREAAAKLVAVAWFGQRIRFTATAGADAALRKTAVELARLPVRFRRYLRPSGGTFNWRNIANTNRLSVHSFGAAIDINTKFTDYWLWKGGKPGNVPAYRNQIPAEIVEIFERHGFVWGGRWYRFDTMHFEYRPAIIAIARLNAQRGCRETG